jgi:hypothetical protein
MRRVIAPVIVIGCILGAAMLTTCEAMAAAREPRHCEPTLQAWWAKYLYRFEQSNGARGVDLARSIPELGIAHITWGNGVKQIAIVAEVEGYSACVVDRLTIK